MNLILNGESEGLHLKHIEGKIVMGGAVNLIPLEQQKLYAEQISLQLAKYSEWANPKTAEELEWEMREARTVLCLNPYNQELFAFGKVGYYGVNEVKQVLYEFGSWVCLKGNGYGKQVLEAARDLSAEQFPYARLIAIVRPSNHKAQDTLAQSGGVKVGYLEPEMKHVYDITRRQQPVEVIKMGSGGIWIWQQNQKHII